MNFKTGDRVRFLNEIGEGNITGFQDVNVAIVNTDDGFEIPTLIKELIKVEGGENNSFNRQGMNETVAVNQPQEEKTPDNIETTEGSGIYLAIVKKGVDTISVTLVNDSDYQVQYILCSVKDKKAAYLNSGTLEDNTKIIIKKYSFEEFKSLETVVFQCIMFGKKAFSLQGPVNKRIKLSGISFRDKMFVENDFFSERAIIMKMENDDLEKELNKLTSDDLQKIIKQKEPPMQTVGDFLKKKKNPEVEKKRYEEVDLHIESIIDDHSHMSPGEIINAQLSRFEISLNGAIRSNQRRIVFIHGVGNGKLKYELGKIMERKYPDLKFQDASFKEYGYGAMMVIIK